MKILCLTVSLLTVLSCNAQENEVFTTIFASKGQIFVGKSDNLTEAKKFKNFKRYVTSLARFEDYLYVSVKRMYFFSKDSAIWRAKLIINSTNTGIDDKSWMNFDVMNKSKEDIRCMTVAKGYIYAGRSDGIMRRCSIEEPINCTTFNQFNHSDISGIDYNPGEDKIYAALLNGTVKRCSPDTAYSCEDINLPVDFISAIRIKFDALWLGVRKESKNHGNWLMKCPILADASEFRENCQFFEKHPDGEFVKSIQASSRHLYFNVWNQTNINRRDPSDNSSDIYTFSMSQNVTEQLDTFLIV